MKQRIAFLLPLLILHLILMTGVVHAQSSLEGLKPRRTPALMSVSELNLASGHHIKASKTTSMFTPGSRLHLVWDKFYMKWDSLHWDYYSYTSSGKLLRDSVRTYTGSWSNEGRYINTYNSNEDITFVTGDFWISGAWKLNGADRFSYLYDSSNHPLVLIAEFQFPPAPWISDKKYIGTFSPDGNLLTRITQWWGTSDWINYERDTYTYDSVGESETLLIEIAYGGGAWTPVARYMDMDWYNYSKGLRSHVVRQEWNGLSWDNIERHTTTYGANDSYLDLIEIFDAGSWHNVILTQHDNDLYGNTTVDVDSVFEAGEWTVYEGTRNKYSYDADGNILIKVEQHTSGVVGDTIYYNKDKYVYSDYLVGIKDPIPVQTMNIWPNPSSGSLNISLPHGNWTFRLISPTGATISVKPDKTTSGIWNLSLDSFSSGIYFIEASDGERSETRKLILQ
jgi:hypothetical protein